MPTSITTYFIHTNFKSCFFVSATEKPLDDALKVNEQLCLEIASTQEEYKRLRGVIDQLSREYETSKDLDLFRRYGMLKGMIKRSVLHLKLSNEDKNHAQSAVAEQRQKEDLRKREEHLTGWFKETMAGFYN